MSIFLHLLALLPFVHVLMPSDPLFPRRGLLVETDGATAHSLHLVLGWKGGRHWHPPAAPRMYWARLTFLTSRLFCNRATYGRLPSGAYGPTGFAFGWPWESWRWEFAHGVTPMAESDQP